MKKSLLKALVGVSILVLMLTNKLLAQTVTFSANTNGVNSQTNLLTGQNDVVLLGVTLSTTISTSVQNPVFEFASSINYSNYFSSFKIFGTTSGGYSSLTQFSIANTWYENGRIKLQVNNNTGFNITPSTPYTIYLVGSTNFTGSLPQTFSVNFSRVFSYYPPVDYNNSSSATAKTYTLSNPTYALGSANSASNNITQGGLTPTKSNIVLFGFSVACSSNTTISGFNINAANTGGFLSSYFSAGRLYRSSSSAFTLANATLVASNTNVTFNSNSNSPGVTIGGLSEPITPTPVYYFLVADFTGSGSLPATVQFKLETTQTNAIIQTSPNSSNIAATSNINGTSFTLANPSYTFTSANTASNGITQGPLYPGQTGAVIFGCGISASENTTISGFALGSVYTAGRPDFYFNNTTAKLYKSTSNVFSLATATPTSATVAFGNSGSLGATITGLSQQITSTPVYFFIVADINYNFNTINAASATVQLNFETSRSNSITQTLPNSATFSAPSNISGTNYTMNPPTLTATGANGTANGITPGVISYGQTDIVMFGMKLTVAGVINITQFDFQANMTGSADINQTFLNGRVYRSADQYFSHASLVSGTTIGFNGTSSFTVSGLNEWLNSTTGTPSYYYFIVADYPTSRTNAQGGSMQIRMNSGSQTVVGNPYKVYNNLSVTDGRTFTIVNTYKWTGSVAGQETNIYNAGNFLTLNNNAVASSPFLSGSGFVTIGSVANYPVIAANSVASVSGISFTTSDAKITLSSGSVLNITSGINVTSGGTANIVGPGIMYLDNASASYVSSTGIIKLTNNAQLSNTAGGRFTLKSDASGSAAIDQLSGSAKFNGTFNVERFITGGANYRSYRLLSSPTNITTANAGAGNIDLGYLTGTTLYTGMLTGAPNGTGGGFAVTNGVPTIYLYREDVLASNSTFNSGKHKGITAIKSSGSTAAVVDIAAEVGAATTITDRALTAGTGFISFNAGSTGQPGNVTLNTSPNSYAITSIGYLNQGTITFKNWYTNQSTLSYNFTSALATNRGFNMVGNPYACTLDLSSFYTTNTASIQPAIFELKSALPGQAYVSYNLSTGATSDPSASRYIASGQGFIVQAKTASQTLTFRESHKSAAQQLTANNLLLGMPVDQPKLTGFYLKVEQDTATTDYCGVYFGTDSDDFDDNDAVDLDGASPKVYMSSYTADGRRTGINSLGDYKNGKTIKLYVAGTTDGLYQLSIEDIKNISNHYDIWLKDAYKKDSLDFRANKVYSFNVVRSDANTFGANRFQIIVRRKKLPGYQFLSLKGARTGNTIKLTWNTQNEYDFTGFTVERLDANNQYVPLKYIQSSGLGLYTYTDNNPNQGVNTYRIKQDDIDNKIFYSTDVNIDPVIKNLANKSIVVYPNPANTPLINVDIVKPFTGQASVMIVNSSGGLESKNVFTQKQGTVDISKLKAGIYYLKVTSILTGEEIGSDGFIKL